MTHILLCSLHDRVYHRPPVYTMTVKRVASLPSCDLLVPSPALVYGHKYYHGDARFRAYAPVSDEAYIAGYRDLVMSRIQRIASWYRALPVSHDCTLTLCCYCPEGAFCHRQLVYKLFLWLNGKLGLSHVIELH